MKKQFADLLLAQGFEPSPDPQCPPFRKQIDHLHLMEAGLNKRQTHFELTVSREADGVVAIAITPVGNLEKTMAEYAQQIADRTKQLTRNKPGRKPKAQ